ncbi:uncharacterized protein LOC131840831 [Achroia grisella]|uniref:uncharacterized protein LOC131840831 n=1 Tax=Achroia grisella TaxID=688607 RepID=UPI0027D1EF3A|nr:uncharacterized protein LOC131840831 [Achroia grisella]
MQKQKDTSFNEKFRLLCSQSNSEEISWSSDSSEYENVREERILNSSHKAVKRKRKKTVSKNISNLDIKYTEGQTDSADVLNTENKLFDSEIEYGNCNENIATSPILTSKNCHKSFKYTTSPIISRNNLKYTPKSPILMLKCASPKYSPKIRKKLFNNNENISKSVDKSNYITNKALNIISTENITCNVHKGLSFKNINHKVSEENYRKNINKYSKRNQVSSEEDQSVVCYNEQEDEHKYNDQDNLNKKNVKTIHSEKLPNKTNIEESVVEKKSIVSGSLDNSIEMLKAENLDLNLVKKVKTYFDGYFSSENASQHSISDALTPKNSSKSSEDIEIVSSITQVNVTKNSSETAKEENCMPDNKTSKKIKYKKDGLAYRLNGLLKKHNANISLWHHERFLATNSNFVIPKGEHIVFQIWNVQFKYGCYLLDVRNVENNSFLVLINNNYVNDLSISENMILKIYEPYNIIDLDTNYKIIINVCKFECLAVDM